MSDQKPKKHGTNAYGLSTDPRDQPNDSPEEVQDQLRRRSYARHFAGYTERPVFSKNGHVVRVERVYTGKLYRQELDRPARIRLRVLHVALFAAAAALLVAAMVMHSPSNYCWYVLLSLLVPLFFFGRLFFALCAYLPSGQELKAHEYNDGAGILPGAAAAAAVSILAPAAATAVFYCLTGAAWTGAEAVRILFMALSAACLLVSRLLERRVRYTEHKAEQGQ